MTQLPSCSVPVNRLKGIEGPRLVFVTTTVADWQPLLRSHEAASIATLTLSESVTHFSGSLVGYVVMPNHVHFLAALPELAQLSRLMQGYKGLSSRRLREAADTPVSGGSVWMRRFDDLIVISERQFRIKLEYIHNNPVRAGLTSAAVDWPFSSARDWFEGEPGLVPVDTQFSWSTIYR
jgi:putative transposase